MSFQLQGCFSDAVGIRVALTSLAELGVRVDGAQFPKRNS